MGIEGERRSAVGEGVLGKFQSSFPFRGEDRYFGLERGPQW